VYATGGRGTVGVEAGADGASRVVRPRTNLMDLNTASDAELERLPDIVPVTAGPIVAYR
jgi:DNA uptake protein ComE-like DNA-binding protein